MHMLLRQECALGGSVIQAISSTLLRICSAQHSSLQNTLDPGPETSTCYTGLSTLLSTGLYIAKATLNMLPRIANHAYEALQLLAICIWSSLTVVAVGTYVLQASISSSNLHRKHGSYVYELAAFKV